MEAKTHVRDSHLTVELGRRSIGRERSTEIECLLDVSALGEIIGIEILYLASVLGRRALEGYDWPTVKLSETIRASYDVKSDAFYLTLVEGGRSLDQRAVVGKAIIDDVGHLVSLEVPID